MKYMLQMELEIETHAKTLRQHLYVACQESVGEVLEKCHNAYVHVEQTNAGSLFKLVRSVPNKILVLTVCASVCCSWCRERHSFVA